MNAEPPNKMRGPINIPALVVCALVVAAIVVALMGKSGRVVTFKIVDRETGLPVTNVTVCRYEKWTRLPLEKLRVRGLHSSRSITNICETDTISMRVPTATPEVMRRGFLPQVRFASPGYHVSIFYRTNDQSGIVLGTGPTDTKVDYVTITIDPIAIRLRRDITNVESVTTA